MPRAGKKTYLVANSEFICMKLTRHLSTALTSMLLLMPALAQAHPGHSAFDPTAGPVHAGHGPEWASLALFVAVSGGLLGLRWLASQRH
ncbi:MAG: hypothetical protein JWL59_2058 [Chthoniobacteraceae bacterium]|nr:hypothetical protein [Chthoniobacteraceae bacterium]